MLSPDSCRYRKAIYTNFLDLTLAEQTDLEKTLNNMREQQSEVQTESHDIDKWMDTISQYMDIKTLDRPTLLELIDTITIGEGRKVNGKRHQDITINYRFIGNLLENAKEDII